MFSPLSDRADALLLLVLALGVDALCALFPLASPLLTLPARELGAAIAWADKRLNRIERQDTVRRARGLLLVITLGGAGLLLALALAAAAPHLRLAWLVQLVLVASGLGLGRWGVMARDLQAGIATAVRQAAERKKTPPPEDAAPPEDAIRQALKPHTAKSLWDTDLHGVLRAALEALAVQYARGLVAPLFWLVILGVPGLVLWGVVRITADVIGHRTPRYRDFGAASRDILAILDAAPARLSVLLLALACLGVPGTKPRGALAAFKAARGHAEGPAALPIAALAGALGLSLAGPRREGEVVVREGWLGDGRARVTTGDVKPALALLAAANLLAIVFALLIDVL